MIYLPDTTAPSSSSSSNSGIMTTAGHHDDDRPPVRKGYDWLFTQGLKKKKEAIGDVDWRPPYTPIHLQTAYKVKAKIPQGRTIAIVGAYAHPQAQEALDFYRSTFGLPPTTITQYNQRGGPISTVTYDAGWGQEQMLDLQMASAICPSCKLVYVGAKSPQTRHLYTAVRFAQTVADVVSMSFGADEDTGYDYNPFCHYVFHKASKVACVASSGDHGFGVLYPAACSQVTAVGGTSLYLTPKLTRAFEYAWGGAGSGCSKT